MNMDSSSLPHSSTTHSLDGLILGQKVYFEDVATLGPTRTKSKTGSGSGTWKVKANGGGAAAPSGGQPSRCQVEGCKLDLSDIKAYYSRHKVCIMHSKSPTVIVAGIQQRFCQQCSRFHKLSEFDQGKRSCRRRLAGHNERRRKPQPGSLSSSRYGQFSSSIFVADDSTRGGRFLMDFSAYPKLSARNAWPNVRSPEQVTVNQPTAQWQSNSPNPSPDIFLQGSITSGTGFSSPQGECFTGVNSTDSTCALSLLSNQPWGPRNRPSSLGLMDVGAQQTTFNQFANNTTTSWGLHEMSPADLGLGQISQQQQQSIDGLESSQQRRHYVELEQSRAYDDSATQHVHWSL